MTTLNGVDLGEKLRTLGSEIAVKLEKIRKNGLECY